MELVPHLPGTDLFNVPGDGIDFLNGESGDRDATEKFWSKVFIGVGGARVGLQEDFVDPGQSSDSLKPLPCYPAAEAVDDPVLFEIGHLPLSHELVQCRFDFGVGRFAQFLQLFDDSVPHLGSRVLFEVIFLSEEPVSTGQELFVEPNDDRLTVCGEVQCGIQPYLTFFRVMRVGSTGQQAA